MTQFYKIDNRRLTYREWWRITSRPTTFLYAALAKFFHIRLPFVELWLRPGGGHPPRSIPIRSPGRCGIASER